MAPVTSEIPFRCLSLHSGAALSAYLVSRFPLSTCTLPSFCPGGVVCPRTPQQVYGILKSFYLYCHTVLFYLVFPNPVFSSRLTKLSSPLSLTLAKTTGYLP